MNGILYIVSTPIWNLEDMTYRAVRILSECDAIACEDTRTSGVLLRHYSIHRPLISFHAHSGDAKIDKIMDALQEWKNIALISDAGTPGISDPGYVLIRAAIEAGIVVVPIPGASAVLSAVVGSGMDMHHFLYLGFLPVKKWRQTLFTSLVSKTYSVVIYESVHRIVRTLAEIEKYFGPEHHIVVARELTKKFEEFKRGNISDVRTYFETEWKCKWEFVVIF
jgi:16S rRNA (cytidine1402-2'-O)-methyltransferase